MTDLKPCPFCGAEMEIPGRDPFDRWKIRHPHNDTCPLDQMTIYEYDEESFERLVEGWNRRTGQVGAAPAVDKDIGGHEVHAGATSSTWNTALPEEDDHD